jgi:hypothetical protein
MTTKRIAEEVLYPEFVSIAKSIGCIDEVVIQGVFGKAPYCWCFNREYGRLKTAAVCFGLISKPKRLLGVDLLASSFSLEVLNERGLDGNCAVFNLNQFQRYQLRRDVDGLSPPQIVIAGTADAESVVKRLRSEIQNLPGNFWEIHERRLAEAGL